MFLYKKNKYINILSRIYIYKKIENIIIIIQYANIQNKLINFNKKYNLTIFTNIKKNNKINFNLHLEITF